MTDLWVAAAITADNEEVFEDWDSDVSGEDHMPEDRETVHVLPQPRPSSSSRRPSSSRRSYTRSPSRPSPFSPNQMGTSLQARFTTPGRRASSVSSRPAIFSNTGLHDEVGYGFATVVPADDPIISAAVEAGNLAPIMEARTASSPGETEPSSVAPLVVLDEKPASALGQLPLMIIFQYGLLALHNTTHDQIFLSYLVS